jgi:hypothetical protein
VCAGLKKPLGLRYKNVGFIKRKNDHVSMNQSSFLVFFSKQKVYFCSSSLLIIAFGILQRHAVDYEKNDLHALSKQRI